MSFAQQIGFVDTDWPNRTIFSALTMNSSSEGADQQVVSCRSGNSFQKITQGRLIFRDEDGYAAFI